MCEDFTRYLIRGDTDSFSVEMQTDTDPPVKIDLLPGDTVYFTVKKSPDVEDIVFQKVITEFVDGRAEIFISHDDTKDLLVKTYYYDIQINRSGNSFVKTVIPPSKFVLEKEVTYE